MDINDSCHFSGHFSSYLVRLCLTSGKYCPQVFIELAHQTLYLTVVLSVM